jgi:Fe2+ or Zn2+ uptake regulation protein
MNAPTSPPWQPDAMIRLVNRKAGLRHPAFGAHSGVTDRNQLQHDRILAVMAEPEGDSFHPRDLHRRLTQRGTPMNMSAIYSALKRLAAEGAIEHMLVERNGRAVSTYRLPEHEAAAPSEAAGRLVCTGCRRSVDLRGTGLLSRLIADAGKAHGLPLPVEAVEVQVLCEACREARDD